MTSQKDPKFEEALRQALSDRGEPWTFSQAMQDEVIRRVREIPSDAPTGRRRRRWSAWLPFGSAAAVVLLAAVFALRSEMVPGGVRQAARPETAAGGVAYGPVRMAGMNHSAAELQASLAPVATQGLSLRPSSKGLATRGRGAPPQLARQSFTVSCRLYNASDRPIQGGDLQGMLFILRHSGGLTPTLTRDWEYFVNGPHTVIPPHASVDWSFAPNPAPAFRSLLNRQAHLVWMLRSPDSGLPSVRLGALPVRVSGVRVYVTGVGPDKIQFLKIIANVTNLGTNPWVVRSSLGMLFFSRRPNAPLLSRGTYKYFDDPSPAPGFPATVRPNETTRVEFIITGVPRTAMSQEPLTILLVPRNQIGA